MSRDVWFPVAELAAEQSGLVTAAQIKRLGITDMQLHRMERDTIVSRVRRGVYRIRGAPTTTAEGLRAAWLSLDPARTASERLDDDPPTAVVSHRSAAVLHGLGVLDADRHEFVESTGRRTRDHGIWLHRGTIASSEWNIVDGLPVVTVVKVVGQLADALVDGDHLARVVSDAVRTGKTTVVDLADALSPFAHRYGAPLGDGRSLVVEWVGRDDDLTAIALAQSASLARHVD